MKWPDTPNQEIQGEGSKVLVKFVERWVPWPSYLMPLNFNKLKRFVKWLDTSV